MQCAYMACKSEESFIFVKNALHDMYKKLKEFDDCMLQKENEHVPLLHEPNNNRVVDLLLDPNISKTKGRSRKTNDEIQKETMTNKKRMKSGLEKATKKKRVRVCRMCLGINVGHDSRNCPKNPRTGMLYDYIFHW